MFLPPDVAHAKRLLYSSGIIIFMYARKLELQAMISPRPIPCAPPYFCCNAPTFAARLWPKVQIASAKKACFVFLAVPIIIMPNIQNKFP
mmetsp:Transcript_47546/g.75204  ORF Transcript_47546/g.75204 Transcript_47546/m.75204 type:complete len:90 (-) Transcript_47546:957-1226(-)